MQEIPLTLSEYNALPGVSLVKTKTPIFRPWNEVLTDTDRADLGRVELNDGLGYAFTWESGYHHVPASRPLVQR